MKSRGCSGYRDEPWAIDSSSSELSRSRMHPMEPRSQVTETSDLFARSRPETCLSDLMLDRILHEEIKDELELTPAQAPLTACKLCASRLAELRAKAQDFPEEIWLAGMVQRALRGSRLATVKRFGSATIGLVAVAALALFLWPRLERPSGERT